MGSKNWQMVAILGLALMAPFNNCSDVSFSSSDSLNDGFEGENPNPCGAVECGEPQLVEETLVVPVIGRKVDVLLVVDNSRSMSNELSELGDRLDGFVQALDSKSIDWQMCVTTTDITSGGISPEGSLVDWTVPSGTSRYAVLKSTTSNRASVFRDTMEALGRSTGDGEEQGITAMSLAIQRGDSRTRDCFRDDAALAVVLLSDEDQKSCGGTCADHPGTSNRDAHEYTKQYRDLTDSDQPIFFVQKAKERFGAKPVAVHSIVIKPGDQACLLAQDVEAPAFYGGLYALLSRTTGGVLGSICAESYASQLTTIGDNIESSLSSLALNCPPVSRPEIVVGTSAAGSSGWSQVSNFTYSGNRVIFNPAIPPGNTVKIRYTCLRAVPL